MKRKSRIILALTAVIITTVMLRYTNQTAIPKDATWDDVVAEAQSGGYRLISTDELKKRYQSKTDTLLLVDTRQEWEYRSGHIKGAVNLPMEPTWLSRWRKKGELERLLGADKDRFIVFY
jgi:3-mercaptopyruvate sulfurtransferase SseA